MMVIRKRRAPSLKWGRAHAHSRTEKSWLEHKKNLLDVKSNSSSLCEADLGGSEDC